MRRKSTSTRPEKKGRRLTSEMDVHLVTIEVGVVGVTEGEKRSASVSESEGEEEGRRKKTRLKLTSWRSAS